MSHDNGVNRNAASLASKRLPQLNDTNWYSFKMLFETYMHLAGLGVALQPPPATSDSHYDDCSLQALRLLTMYVDDAQLLQITAQAFPTFYGAFRWLEAANVAGLQQQILAIRSTLDHLRQGENEEVEAYCDRAANAYFRLQVMHCTVYTAAALPLVIHKILTGLRDTFDVEVRIIQREIASEVKPRTIIELKSQLGMAQAQQRDRAAALAPPTPPAFPAAFRTTYDRRPRADVRCGHCGRAGHTAAVCHRKYLEDNPGTTFADARAHSRAAAAASGSAPAAAQRPRARANQARGDLTDAQLEGLLKLARLLDMQEGPSPSSRHVVSRGKWCLDTGTNVHMSASCADLTNYHKLTVPMKVLFAGNTTGDIVGVGATLIPATNGTYAMQQVLHVPDLVENLFSLSDCWRQKIGVNFDPHDDIVTFVQNGTVIMTAAFDSVTGLFYLNTEHHARAAVAAGAATPLDAHYWHRALGHVSFTMLARMKRANLLPSTCIVTPEEFLQARHVVCEPCLKGKNTRDSRPPSKTVVPHPCHILHADVLTLNELDVNGHKYCLCVVDGKTAKCVVHLLKDKSDVKLVFPDIVAMFERQGGHPVLRVRTDRGGEFMNAELQQYFRAMGILYEHTAGHSSESNGVAERMNRTLMDKARTMVKAASVPTNWWGYALIMANQLHNWIPVSTKHTRSSPDEAFHGVTPNLSYLQPFGAVAYVHVPTALRKKLDDHVVKGTLIGFAEPAGSHTYIVRMPNGTIRTSRDVTFDQSHVVAHIPVVEAPPLVGEALPDPTGAAVHGDDDWVLTDTTDETPAVGDAPVQAAPERHTTRARTVPLAPYAAPAASAPALAVHERQPPQADAAPLAQASPSVAPAASTPALAVHEQQPPQAAAAPLAQAPPSVAPAAFAPTLAASELVQADVAPLAMPAPGRPLPPTQASERGDNPRIRRPPDRYHARSATPPIARTANAGRLLSLHSAGQPRGQSASQASAAHAHVPTSYRDATHPDRPDRDLWIAAMRSEYNSLLGYPAWELLPATDMPPGARAVGCRWTFALKADGRYKARLVAQGFSQRPGLDFDDTFAPVSKLQTFRALAAVVAHDDLEWIQLDVTTAFLNAPLDEEVYMRQPEGFAHDPSQVCRLLRALYGLRQAPRAWHQTLRGTLLAHGFTPAESDPSMFILRSSDEVTLALVYVDDCLIAGRTLAEARRVADLITSLFPCRDLGEPTLFLGIEIERDRAARTLTITQRALADSILAKYGGLAIKPQIDPMHHKLKLVQDGPAMTTPQEQYGSLLGSLMHLSNGTRPDLAFGVNRLARYTQNPRQAHWDALLHLLGYLLSHPHVGITYGTEGGVRAYSDADLAGDLDDSRSTAGYVITVNGGATSWRSKLQASPAKSTCEAEYRAANSAACEVIWYNKLLPDLGCRLASPININCDNQSACALLKNPMSTEQSKYFRIFWHFGRDAVMRRELTFSYVKTSENYADPFTKALAGPALAPLMAGLGVGTRSRSK